MNFMPLDKVLVIPPQFVFLVQLNTKDMKWTIFTFSLYLEPEF